MVISKKTIIFQGFRGDPTFSRGGGVQLFPGGGVQMLISIETHITPPILDRNRDSSPTRQFTDTHFEDSSPTDLKTVHRQN